MSEAKKNAIPLGTTILRCDPFAHVVKMDKLAYVCDNCFEESHDDEQPFKKCTRCKVAHYCGVKCQKASWRDLHKEECEYLTRVRPNMPTDTARLMARIVLRLRKGGGALAVEAPGGERRRFDDLQSHRREMVKDRGRMEAFDAFFLVVKECFGDATPQKDEMLDIFGRILINSFNIMGVDYLPVGIGLYLEASVLDHSCLPNATIVFEGKTLLLRPVREIAADEPIVIAYCNVLHPTERRRSDLKERYYFHCTCASCEAVDSEEETLKRRSVRWESDKTVQAEYAALEKAMAKRVRKGQEEEAALPMYRKMKSCFHPFDWRYCQTVEAAFDEALDGTLFEEAYDIARDILTAYERFYPEFDVNTGLMLLKAGKIALYLDKLYESEQLLTRAKEVLSVTHGADHRVVTDRLETLMVELKAYKNLS